MNEEKKAPNQEQAATAQPFIPLANPEPAPILGAKATWAAKTGIDITVEDFEDAIGHEPDQVLRAQNAKLPSAWIQGPGAVELLIEGIKLLMGASSAAGLNQKTIHWVLPKLLPKLGLLLVAPVKEGTPGAIETTREGKGPLRFNVSEILRQGETEVVSGYRELFAVEKVATSPIGPAIAIKLGKPLESKQVGKKKEEQK